MKNKNKDYKKTFYLKTSTARFKIYVFSKWSYKEHYGKDKLVINKTSTFSAKPLSTKNQEGYLILMDDLSLMVQRKKIKSDVPAPLKVCSRKWN